VLKQYISYMPQQDAFDEHLTIGENLLFAAAIRAPHLSRRDRGRRLEAKLVELGLGRAPRRGRGKPESKALSGGERKRLNIGLEYDRDVGRLSVRRNRFRPFLKGFRHVMEIIRTLAQQKIVIVTIHQPSSKIFQMFHKAILLDKGGPPCLFRNAVRHAALFCRGGNTNTSSERSGACPPAEQPDRNSFLMC